jgi:hypothetical protein
MALYRKKPIVIEARQIRGSTDLLGPDGIADWSGGVAYQEDPGPACLILPTLEGTMRAHIGSFVIKGVNGEFCPCQEDVFLKTYEAVDE